MKKVYIGISSLVIVMLGGIIVMFVFSICPPKGPWPMPPWCKTSVFEKPVYNLEIEVGELSQVVGINMNDTWGRNYNFKMFETTWGNIESSFNRLEEMGVSEVYVNDFHRAVYKGDWDFKSLDYELVDEIFWNDQRDESINEGDLKVLVDTAHQKGLKIGIKHNIAFVDIGKYIKEGLSGNIQNNVVKDFEEFNSSHSEEWVRDFFSKWESRLGEKAVMYENAGVDIMSITPTWMGPTFKGQEVLANSLWKELIASLKEKFNGEIHCSISIYGFLINEDGEENWELYDYYKDVDILEVPVYMYVDEYNTVSDLVGAIDLKAKEKGVNISLFFAPFSYSDSMVHGIVEIYDVYSDAVEGKEKDWDYQAQIYQELFEALNGKENISRVISGGYWWDDEIDPDVKPRISLASSIRNKPAEEVVRRWLLGK